ncbi:MAG: acetyltransferase [Desulfobulbaceae bacterium]|nr:acetyltransferase [Desulfobulbaceae bacterium]
MNYDVFNGDADGICALHQLRLDEPREALLISGVKRDIRLLEQLASQPDVQKARITVLDISMDSNMPALLSLLDRGNSVDYFDHHFAGDIPTAGNLKATIDASPDICTGLIVDRLLGGKFRAWAVVAAFGDNLHVAASEAAQDLGLSAGELDILRELGELMNYNGYGRVLSDLHCTPQELFKAVQPYEDPLAFYRESDVLDRLKKGYDQDMKLARAAAPFSESDSGRIYKFPAVSWPRRVAGVFSNEKAREMQEKAHALLVDNGDATFLVSVRAPLKNKQGAVDLCRRFPTGGGREAAAGINALPADQLDAFIEAFHRMW